MSRWWQILLGLRHIEGVGGIVIGWWRVAFVQLLTANRCLLDIQFNLASELFLFLNNLHLRGSPLKHLIGYPLVLLCRVLSFFRLKSLQVAHYLVNLHLHIEEVVWYLFVVLIDSSLVSSFEVFAWATNLIWNQCITIDTRATLLLINFQKLSIWASLRYVLQV